MNFYAKLLIIINAKEGDMAVAVSYVQIDTAKLVHNIRTIRAHIPTEVQLMAVVKNDAYGNGALKTAELALAHGFSLLGVARVGEALSLKQSGITAPIMILGLVPQEEWREAIQEDFLIPLDTPEDAEALNAVAEGLGKKAQVMVAVDTGLHRIGASAEETGALVSRIRSLPSLKLCGLFTHFIEAELPDKKRTWEQLNLFKETIRQIGDTGGLLISAADSAAAEDMEETRFNMVRIGCLLTGIQPSKEMAHPLSLEPVFSLVSRVIRVQKVRKGETIGYDSTWEAPEDMYVATVPIGYGDGYRRSLSNKASVLIQGKMREIRGLICMDQMMVEADASVKTGDPVVLVGKQGNLEIKATDLAEMCDANVHEFLGGFRRLEKRYI